mgnify:FL=1
MIAKFLFQEGNSYGNRFEKGYIPWNKGGTSWNKGIPNTWFNPKGLEAGWKAAKKRKNGVNKNCLYCGKEFYTSKALMRIKYCSISCGKLKDFPENISIWEEKKRLMQRKEYKIWRVAILLRDNYQCSICGDKNNLHVDHIKSWKEYPELRYAIDNGRVLCAECHYRTDNYGIKIFWAERQVIS